MSCDITKGKIQLACKNVVGGIKAIYLANYADYNFTTVSNASGHTLTDLQDLTTVYKFELKNAGNTFEQTITSNRDNGTTSFDQVLNFVLTKLSKEMEFQMKMMVWGRPQIFVEFNTGQVILMGKDHGCEITGKNGVGGTLDSTNNYTLTATAKESDPVFYVTDSEITALKAMVSSSNITE
jgi:hypothetical protein